MINFLQDYILGSDFLRAEMLGLHFVRERIISTDYKIVSGGDLVRLSSGGRVVVVRSNNSRP